MEVLRRLENCKNNPTILKGTIEELQAYIHIERFDPESAKGVLSEFAGRFDELFAGKNLLEIKCLRIMERHTDRVDSSAITPDGGLGLSGSNDKTLRLWNLKTGGCLRTMEGHTDEVNSCAITPDGGLGLSGSKDNTLRFWNLKTGECLRIMKGHTSSVYSCAITPDGGLGLSGSVDKTLILWRFIYEIEFD